MELECDLSSVKSEEMLRKMWQQSEDVNRKKEIRSHLYKLREARLRDLYQGDIMAGNQSPGFGKDPLTSYHGDSLADQSFHSLKSKEIRDSMSPTQDLKFHSMTLNQPNTTGWNVQSSSEVSPDGRACRSETVATTDGIEKINGGLAEYQGRNEQHSSASHQGDDKNYVKKASESSKSHLEEKVVVGDESSGRTEMKMSSTTSSSHQEFSSSSTVEYGGDEPVHGERFLKDDHDHRVHHERSQHERQQQERLHQQRLQEERLQQERFHQGGRRDSDRQYTEQYENNRRESKTNVETQRTQEQSRRYVDMDKASPEYQQHVQYLMAQPGEVISNTVEYPKPNVKMITTVKRLPDGTIVKNKRYETEELHPSTEKTHQRSTTSSSNTSNQQSSSQRQRDEKLTQEHDNVRRQSQVRKTHTPDRHLLETHPVQLPGEEVTQSFSSVKKSSRRFSTETTSETIEEHDDHSPRGKPSGSTPKSHPSERPHSTRPSEDFSTHGFPSVRSDKPTKEYPTDRPERYVTDSKPSQSTVVTADGDTIIVSKESSRSYKQKTSSEQTVETEYVSSEPGDHHPEALTYGKPQHKPESFTTHGFPSVRPDKLTREYPSERPHAMRSSDVHHSTEHNVTKTSHPGAEATPHHRTPDTITTPDGETIVVSKESSRNYKQKFSSERNTETEYITSDSGDHRPEAVTHVKTSHKSEDFSTHGFPSVREGTPVRDSYVRHSQTPTRDHPSQPSTRSPTKPGPSDVHGDVYVVSSEAKHSSKHQTNREHIIETVLTDDDHHRPGHPSVRHPHHRPDDFSTHGFPSVRDNAPVLDDLSPRQGTPTRDYASSSPRRSPVKDDYSTHGFPSVRSPTRTTPKPTEYVHQIKRPTTSSSPTKKTSSPSGSGTSTTDGTHHHVHKEKPMDNAHRAFAASLRSSSPIDHTDYHQRSTPRSSISSAKPYRRDGREGSHDSSAPSETSRISSNTVTRSTPPKTVGRHVVTTTSVKTKNVNGTSDTQRSTPSPSSPSSPTKTVTTTTTRTTTTRKTPTTTTKTTTVKTAEVPKSDNQLNRIATRFTTTKSKPKPTPLKSKLKSKPAEISEKSQKSPQINEPLTISKAHITSNDASFGGRNTVVEKPCVKAFYYQLGPSDHPTKQSTTDEQIIPATNVVESPAPNDLDTTLSDLSAYIDNQMTGNTIETTKTSATTKPINIDAGVINDQTILKTQGQSANISEKNTKVAEETKKNTETKEEIIATEEKDQKVPENTEIAVAATEPEHPKEAQNQKRAETIEEVEKKIKQEKEPLQPKEIIQAIPEVQTQAIASKGSTPVEGQSIKDTAESLEQSVHDKSVEAKISMVESKESPPVKKSEEERKQEPLQIISDTVTVTDTDKKPDAVKLISPLMKQQQPSSSSFSPIAPSTTHNKNRTNHPKQPQQPQQPSQIYPVWVVDDTGEHDEILSSSDVEIIESNRNKPSKPNDRSPNGERRTVVRESTFDKTDDETIKIRKNSPVRDTSPPAYETVKKSPSPTKTYKTTEKITITDSTKKSAPTQRQQSPQVPRKPSKMTPAVDERQPSDENYYSDEDLPDEKVPRTSQHQIETKETTVEIKIKPKVIDDQPRDDSPVRVGPSNKNDKSEPKTQDQAVDDNDYPVWRTLKKGDKPKPKEKHPSPDRYDEITKTDDIFRQTRQKQMNVTENTNINEEFITIESNRPKSKPKSKPNRSESPDGAFISRDRQPSPSATSPPSSSTSSPTFRKKGLTRRETFEDRCRVILGMEDSGDTQGTYKPKPDIEPEDSAEPSKQPQGPSKTPETPKEQPIKLPEIVFEVKIEDCDDNEDDDKPIYISSVRKSKEVSPKPIPKSTGKTTTPKMSGVDIEDVEDYEETSTLKKKHTTSVKKDLSNPKCRPKTKILSDDEKDEERAPRDQRPEAHKSATTHENELVKELKSNDTTATVNERTTIIIETRPSKSKSPESVIERRPEIPIESEPESLLENETEVDSEMENYVSEKVVEIPKVEKIIRPSRSDGKPTPKSNKRPEPTFSPAGRPTKKVTEETTTTFRKTDRKPTPTDQKPKRRPSSPVKSETSRVETSSKTSKIKSTHISPGKEDSPSRVKPSKEPIRVGGPKTERKETEIIEDSIKTKRYPRKPSTESPSPSTSIKDRLRSSTRKTELEPDDVDDAPSSADVSPDRRGASNRRRSSNISVHTEIIIEHNGPKSPAKDEPSSPRKSVENPLDDIDTLLMDKPTRKLPVTERKESAPVHRVTRRDKDIKMSRSTSENVMKVTMNGKPGSGGKKPEMSSLSPSTPHKSDRRPNKCFTTKTINLSNSDKVIHSEDMENVVIDIQQAKSSREPSPDKIIPTPVPAHFDTGKPRYPDVVQEPEDEPRRRPVVTNIPIFEEETNDYVGCQISEIHVEKIKTTDHIDHHEEFLDNPIVEAPKSLDYPSIDKPDDDCLLSVHEKVSKFTHTAEEVRKPKPSSPFSREFEEGPKVPEGDVCLLTVDQKVSKFLKTAEEITKPITPVREVERPNFDDLDDELRNDECVLTVSQKVSKFTAPAEKLAPTTPQKSPQLVAKIERTISKQSEPEYSDSNLEDEEEPTTPTPTPFSENHSTHIEMKRQKDILSRPSVWEKNTQNTREETKKTTAFTTTSETTDEEELIPMTKDHTTIIEMKRQQDILSRPTVFDRERTPVNDVNEGKKMQQSPLPKRKIHEKPERLDVYRETQSDKIKIGNDKMSKTDKTPRKSSPERRRPSEPEKSQDHKTSSLKLKQTTSVSSTRSRFEPTPKTKENAAPLSTKKTQPQSEPVSKRRPSTDMEESEHIAENSESKSTVHRSRITKQIIKPKDGRLSPTKSPAEPVKTNGSPSTYSKYQRSSTVASARSRFETPKVDSSPSARKPLKESPRKPSQGEEKPKKYPSQPIATKKPQSDDEFETENSEYEVTETIVTRRKNSSQPQPSEEEPKSSPNRSTSQGKFTKFQEVSHSPTGSSPSSPFTNATTITKITERTVKHNSVTERPDDNEPMHEPILDKVSPLKKPKVPGDTVAARRNLFEKSGQSPPTVTPKKSSPMETDRRPSYMDHTRCSLEHMRRDSLEVNKQHYSRKSSFEDETHVERRPNSAVKFDVPQRSRKTTIESTVSTEDINVEDIFDLEILEHLLESVTSYELRRRIRAQIRLVKKNILNTETTNISSQTSSTLKSSSTYSSQKHQEASTETFSDADYETKKPRDSSHSPSRSPTSGRPPKDKSSDRSHSPQAKTISSSMKEVHHTTSGGQYARSEQVDYASEYTAKIASPALGRKHLVADKHDRPLDRPTSKPQSPTEKKKSDRSPIRDVKPKSQTTPRSPSPMGKSKSIPQERSRSPSPPTVKTQTSQREEVRKYSRSSISKTHSPERRSSKPKSDEKTPVWADRKNILKGPGSATPKKPMISTTASTRSSAMKTTQSQRQVKTAEEEDSIISSYGIGPTDENGLPLFGIRALKKKNKQPTPQPCETTEEVTGYVIEEKYYSDNKSKPIVERKEFIYSTNDDELEQIKKEVESKKSSKDEAVITRKFQKIDKEFSPEPEAIMPADDEFAMMSTKKYVRRGSVKEMSEKFIRKESSQSITEKSSSGSYPKAGLILRTNSRRGMTDADDDFDGEIKMSRRSSDRSKSTTPTTPSRRRSEEEADEYEINRKQQMKKRMSSERESAEYCASTSSSSMKKSSSSSARSFLNSGGEARVVSGVDDVLERMRNADNVVEEGDSAEDQEARALLNKFLGASVMMKGVESVIPTTQTKIITTTSRSRGVDDEDDDYGQREIKTTRVTKTIKSESSSTPVTYTTCDIEEIWDEDILKELLEKAKTYEERRKIRSRLRELMADREDKKTKKAGAPVPTTAEEEVDDSSSASEYEEIIEEVTDYSDAEEEPADEVKPEEKKENRKSEEPKKQPEVVKSSDAEDSPKAAEKSDKPKEINASKAAASADKTDSKQSDKKKGESLIPLLQGLLHKNKPPPPPPGKAIANANVKKAETANSPSASKSQIKSKSSSSSSSSTNCSKNTSTSTSTTINTKKHTSSDISTTIKSNSGSNKKSTVNSRSEDCDRLSSNTQKDTTRKSSKEKTKPQTTKTISPPPQAKNKEELNVKKIKEDDQDKDKDKDVDEDEDEDVNEDDDEIEEETINDTAHVNVNATNKDTDKMQSTSDNVVDPKRVNRLSVPQKEDSGTESGEDLRLIAAGLRDQMAMQDGNNTNLINEVTRALSRLESSLKEGKELAVDDSRRNALLALIARLQTGLTSPETLVEAARAVSELEGSVIDYNETSSPEADAHRSSKQRFAKRRNRNSRHTVGVSREELADARRYMEDMMIMENISSCTTPDSGAVVAPQWFPLEKNASVGAISPAAYSQQQSQPSQTLYRPNQFVPSNIKSSTECLSVPQPQFMRANGNGQRNRRPLSGDFSVSFERQDFDQPSNGAVDERCNNNASPERMNRFSNKRQMMKRANTIDIPKSKKFNPDFDTDSDAEDRGPIFGLKRTVQVNVKQKPRQVVPPFEPKTENDHKFLAFINKQSPKPGLGWTGSRSVSNWTNKFGSIKHTFEVGAAATATTGKPPQVPGHVPQNAAKNYWSRQVNAPQDYHHQQHSQQQQHQSHGREVSYLQQMERQRQQQQEVVDRQRRQERERFERERIERDRLERQRLERENLDREKMQREYYERECLERDRVQRQKMERERLERERLERERLDRDRMERERREREYLERERFERERIERDRLERERLDREHYERERIAAQQAAINGQNPNAVNNFIHAPQSVFRPIDNLDSPEQLILKPIPQMPQKLNNTWHPPSLMSNKPLTKSTPSSPQFLSTKHKINDSSYITTPPPSANSPVGLPWAFRPTADSRDFRSKANRFEERSQNDNRNDNGYLQRHNSLRAAKVQPYEMEDMRKRPSLPNASDPYMAMNNQYMAQQKYVPPPPARDNYPPPPVNISYAYADTARNNYRSQPCLPTAVHDSMDYERPRPRRDSLTNPEARPLVLTSSNPLYSPRTENPPQPFASTQTKQFDYPIPMDSAPTSPSLMTMQHTDYTDDDMDSELMTEYRVESKVMGKPQSQTAVTVGRRTAHMSDDEVFGKNSHKAKSLLNTMKTIGSANKQKKDLKRPERTTSPKVCLSPDGGLYQAPLVEPIFPDLTKFEPNRTPLYVDGKPKAAPAMADTNRQQPPHPSAYGPLSPPTKTAKWIEPTYDARQYEDPRIYGIIQPSQQPPVAPSRQQVPPPVTIAPSAPVPTPYTSEARTAYVVTYPIEDHHSERLDVNYSKQHPTSLPLQRNRNYSETSTASSSMSHNMPSPSTNWTPNPIHTIDDMSEVVLRKNSISTTDERSKEVFVVQKKKSLPNTQKPDIAPKPELPPPTSVRTQQTTKSSIVQQTKTSVQQSTAQQQQQKPYVPPKAQPAPPQERERAPKLSARSQTISSSTHTQSFDRQPQAPIQRQTTLGSSVTPLQAQNRVLSQQSLVSKQQQQFEQQREQITEVRRKSMGNALETQQKTRKTAYYEIQQEYKSSAPADTPDIVKSSLPKEDMPILKKFGPPQRHHYMPNSYQNPLSSQTNNSSSTTTSHSRTAGGTTTSKTVTTSQREIVQHSTHTAKPSIVETPATPQPTEDLIPRNIVFNNISAFTSLATRRPDTERSPAANSEQWRPNRLSKCDSWNQIVQLQQQAAPSSPKFNTSGNELRRTKSGHSLAGPKMFEAGLDKTEINEKQKTVAAYFSGKKSPSNLNVSEEFETRVTSKKSSINRTKTSEKVSASRKSLSSMTAEGGITMTGGGLTRSATMPHIANLNLLDESNVEDAFEQLMMEHKPAASSSTTEKTETKEKDGAIVTTTTKVTTRTVTGTGTAPKPVSPFAKFRQLDKQNSQQSPKSSSTSTTPSGGSTTASPSGSTLFKFTDPALNARAATFKDQLLQWCQSKTKEYENVEITNFSTSWSDGLAFCALIHHFLPDAFDYTTLTPQSRRHNFELAFTVADEKAGIAPLLDVEDMVVMRRPDWKCVFVYVQSIYRRFRNCQ